MWLQRGAGSQCGQDRTAFDPDRMCIPLIRIRSASDADQFLVMCGKAFRVTVKRVQAEIKYIHVCAFLNAHMHVPTTCTYVCNGTHTVHMKLTTNLSSLSCVYGARLGFILRYSSWQQTLRQSKNLSMFLIDCSISFVAGSP